MNPQDPLAALQPLREPGLISWWPLAPGWWLLGALLLILLIAGLVALLRRYRANAYRRQALVRLQALQQAFEESNNRDQYVARLNALLKSVALVAYPRREVAAISGDKWLAFLNSGIDAKRHFEPAFTNAVYRETCADLDMDKVQHCAHHWIRRHEVAR